MKMFLFALALLAAVPAGAADPARRAAAGEQHPGYGVVEMITPLRRPAEPSASAGASAPRRDATGWLVKVRMDDGTIQVREIRKRTVAVGNRVLLTNAGDVLPD